MEAFRSTPGRCAYASRMRPLSQLQSLSTQIIRREAMGEATQHHAINYVEFATTDIEKTKQVYGKAFGWTFQDWGPDYISFSKANAGVDRGFRKGQARAESGARAHLVVLH